MIPTLSVPNIQVAPAVEMSVFTGQNSDAALGRLPVVTVPPAISNNRVSDDNRGQSPAQRNTAATSKPSASAAPFSLGGSLGGTGELVFESPYSTTFVAQLFGQFQALDGGLGESIVLPLDFVDFERLSQFNVTKYMPSFASHPQLKTPAPAEIVATQPMPMDTEVNEQPVASNDAPPSPPALDTTSASASLFSASGPGAYSSTQSRNTLNLNGDSRGGTAEVSLVS